MMLEGKIYLKRCTTWKKNFRIFKEPSGPFQEVFHNDIIDGP